MKYLKRYTTGLAMVVTKLPQAVIIVDRDGRIQYANEYASQFFAIGRLDLMHITLDTLIAPTARQELMRHVQELIDAGRLAEQKSATLLTSVTKKRRHILVQVTLIQILSEDKHLDVLLRFDRLPSAQTNHVHVEHQLQQASASSEAINALDLLDDPVIILDKHWRYQFVNKKGWEVLHRDPSEILGYNVWKLRPDLNKTAWKRLAKKAMATQQKLDLEEFYPRSQRWYATTFYPSPNYLLAQMKDITVLQEAKRTNDELLGTFEQAMKAYWSDSNRIRREQRKTTQQRRKRTTQ